MSKRVANCRGRTTARFGRVRLGWRKKHMLTELEKIDKAERLGNLTEEAIQKAAAFRDSAKRTLKRFFPKRTEARGRG